MRFYILVIFGFCLFLHSMRIHAELPPAKEKPLECYFSGQYVIQRFDADRAESNVIVDR